VTVPADIGREAPRREMLGWGEEEVGKIREGAGDGPGKSNIM